MKMLIAYVIVFSALFILALNDLTSSDHQPEVTTFLWLILSPMVVVLCIYFIIRLIFKKL